jgi:hypothetical protein
MQHSKEDGALDGKFEASVFEQSGQNVIDRACLPETLEDQGRPDPDTVSHDAVALSMGAEDGEFSENRLRD